MSDKDFRQRQFSSSSKLKWKSTLVSHLKNKFLSLLREKEQSKLLVSYRKKEGKKRRFYRDLEEAIVTI